MRSLAGIPRRPLAVALLALAAAVLLGAGPALARDFTIASWGGAYQDALRKAYFTPFAQEQKVKFLEDTYLGGWAQFKAMQETGNVPWDLVQVETSELTRGCEEGLFIPLDYSRVFPKSAFVPGAASKCGIGAIVWTVAVAFNTDKVKSPPARQADFFDLKKWPGKRALRKGPKLNLEFALLADGVQPDDVYKTLKTKAGLERAFKKLDTIKAQVQWWEAGAQAPEWLVSGEVTLAMAYSGRVINARKEGKPLGLIWDHNIYATDSWVIVKGAPNIDTAYAALKWFSQPEPQVVFSRLFPYGPTNAKAADLLDAKLLADVPAGANIATALHSGSDDAISFWVDNLEEVTERWNAWVGK